MGQRRGYEPILMDMDGTVVDSVRLTKESFRHAVRSVLAEELSDREMMAYVGQPLMQQMAQLSPEHAGELYEAYREYNHRMHDELIGTYEDIEETLRDLRAAGRRLGLVTSKSTPTVEMAFRTVRLREYFDAVVTASDTTSHKPHPEPLLLCLTRLATPGDRPSLPAPSMSATAHSISLPDTPPGWRQSASPGASSRVGNWRRRAPRMAASPKRLIPLCLGR